jgi:hypothetical protein
MIGVGDILRLLHHPCFLRAAMNAGDADPAGGDVEEEQ